MTYTPQTWIDGSGGNTPISAARLTYQENGIHSAHAMLGGQVLVADLFGRANGALGTANTGQAWTALAGTAEISSNRMLLTGATTVVVDAGTPDVDVSCEIVHTGGSPGIVFRSDTANTDRLACQLDAINGFRLQKVDTNVGTVLQQLPMAFIADGTRLYRLRVVATGDIVRCFLDGELLVNHQLTAAEQTKYSPQTRVGFRSTSSGGRFDNFTVRVPEAQSDVSPIKQVTGSYTLVRSDAGKMIEADGGPITVPPNIFPAGAAVYIVQIGTTAVSVAGSTVNTSTMTVRNAGTIGGQWFGRTLYIRSPLESVLL